MKPLVSVVIPTFNRPLELCELLECLTVQTFSDFEVIIINDAGEDVRFVESLYPTLHINVVHSQVKLHHVGARKKGVSMAKGEYILLCDDDDLLLPGHIERMVQEMKSADLAFSDVEIFEYEKTETVRNPVHRFLFAYEYDPAEMRKFSTYVPSGSMYKASIHQKIGFFDEAVNNYWDWDFILRVIEAGLVVSRVPEASVLYAFGHGANRSSKQEQMRHFLDVLSAKHNLGHLPTKNFYLLLEEESIQKRKAASKRLWDGTLTPSKYARMKGRG